MKKSLLPGLSLFLLLGSCVTTKEVALRGTPENPAAQGSVTAKSNGSGNNRVKLTVKHLAKPTSVAPGASAYVVWIQPAFGESRPQNMGVLHIDENLSGDLNVTVPYDNFVVFVSAEPSGMVTTPSGAKILTTEKTVELNN